MYLRRVQQAESRKLRRMAVGSVALDGTSPFQASTEAWRPLIERMAGDLPVEWLMAWDDRESGGNACSYTIYGEAGIFQLMPPDNIAQAGTTVAALRAACSGSSQSGRALTAAEANEQVRSGVQYANYVRQLAHAKLDAAGVTWSERSPDFWQFAKLQHAYPGPTAGWLAQAKAELGHAPRSWQEFRSTISGYTDVLDNAEWVGAFGAGGGSSLAVPLILGAGLAYAIYRMLT
jgi:hypothetical protein